MITTIYVRNHATGDAASDTLTVVQQADTTRLISLYHVSRWTGDATFNDFADATAAERADDANWQTEGEGVYLALGGEAPRVVSFYGATQCQVSSGNGPYRIFEEGKQYPGGGYEGHGFEHFDDLTALTEYIEANKWTAEMTGSLTWENGNTTFIETDNAANGVETVALQLVEVATGKDSFGRTRTLYCNEAAANEIGDSFYEGFTRNATDYVQPIDADDLLARAADSSRGPAYRTEEWLLAVIERGIQFAEVEATHGAVERERMERMDRLAGADEVDPPFYTYSLDEALAALAELRGEDDVDALREELAAELATNGTLL